MKNLVMLTGDVEQVAKKVAKELGIDKVFSQLMPGDKVAKVEELLGVENAVGDGASNVQNSISTKKRASSLSQATESMMLQCFLVRTLVLPWEPWALMLLLKPQM